MSIASGLASETSRTKKDVMLNYQETKYLIDRVMETEFDRALKVLLIDLQSIGRNSQEFYHSVILHEPPMTSYTSDQWLDFRQKIPHWRLRADKALMNKLSPKHREILGA